MTASSNSTEVNTLVIGGGGYIGAYLVPMLIAKGRRVTVLGRSAKPRYALPEGATYISDDFGRREIICNWLDRHQEIIHLAYATVPNTSFENPLADLLQNLPPTVQLFSEVADRGGKLLLISSSGTVYGEAVKLPICEDHSTKPISPYGVTHGLKFVCVRPANAYGVGQGFISTAIASAMRVQPIRIFGQDGTVRDYIYVSDLASGIMAALEFGQMSETYNLGSGAGLSNKEVVQILSPLMKRMGFETNVEHLPERAFDVKANVLDSTKLQMHTGWKSRIGIEEGLRLTSEWIRNSSV